MLPAESGPSEDPAFNKLPSIHKELLRAEEAIYFLAAIVESSHNSNITINFEGIITSWNKAAQDLYGYSAEEAIGQPLTMLTLSADLREVLRNNESVKHSRRVEMFEMVRVTKDGRHMDLEVVMSPVKDVEGEVVGISIIARDITFKKVAEGEYAGRRTQPHLAGVARQHGPAPHCRNAASIWRIRNEPKVDTRLRLPLMGTRQRLVPA